MAQAIKKVNFNSTNVRVSIWYRRATHLGLQVLGRVAPRYTRQTIMQRFFAPMAYVTTPLENQALKHGRRFLLRVNDKSIHGWQWGHGPQILFVHGWNGRGIQFLPFFKPVIEAGYAVIAVDGPAHGESMGQTTNYFEFTDMVRRIVNPSSGFDIRGVVAHSLGASAVINALAHEAVGIDAALIAPALRLREMLYNTFTRYGVPQWLYTSMISQLETRFGYGLDRDNPIQGAAKIRSRLLLVHDRNDPVTPFTDTRELAESQAHADLLATQGLGHRRIIGDPDVVERTVRFILTDQRQAVATPNVRPLSR
jgi:pimeloyl-ACP methyl ester carboxylesterase